MRPARAARGGLSAEEALFRSRLATFFYGAALVAIGVHLMILLRSVLEPFLWAMFIVMALHPLTQMFHRLLQSLCRRWCQLGAAFARRVRLRFGRSGRSAFLRAFQRPCRGFSFGSGPCPVEAVPAVQPIQAAVAGGLNLDAGAPAPDGIALAEEACDEAFSFISRAVAVLCALVVVIAVLGTIFTIVLEACVVLKKNFDVYEKGVRKAVEGVRALSEHVGAQELLDDFLNQSLERMKGNLTCFLTGTLSSVGNFLNELVMLLLYVIFWLFTPMPYRNPSAGRIFRRYLLFKGSTCLAYGICVYLMLRNLRVDIPEVFGLLSFLFSFIPEVGALVAMVLPVPVILFDSRLETPWATVGAALLGQFLMKFVFANIVEVLLVENDPSMKMHPVVTLLAFCLFGFIWGPTGMLLSVPLVAFAKAALQADLLPPMYRDPVLVFIEGDENAPEANRRLALLA